jgi:hypothetical protein
MQFCSQSSLPGQSPPGSTLIPTLPPAPIVGGLVSPSAI